MKLIIASNNVNKVNEIKEICGSLFESIVSLKEEGIHIDIVEDGSTLEENSLKKAKGIYEYLIRKSYDDFMVLSDDSGLMVEYLNGAPGVLSARFAGEEKNDCKNIQKVLNLLSNVEYLQRDAKFVTIITLIDSNGHIEQFLGEVQGKILNEEKGLNGFGYDPIFYVEEFKKTFAEMDKDQKNSISHRSKSLSKLKKYLENKKNKIN